jgi:hypothetical protein
VLVLYRVHLCPPVAALLQRPRALHFTGELPLSRLRCLRLGWIGFYPSLPHFVDLGRIAYLFSLFFCFSSYS